MEIKERINSTSQQLNCVNQTSYKFIVINCRGLQSKKESFAELIHSHDPHFIAGTESWLNPTITSAEIFPSNYQIFHIEID